LVQQVKVTTVLVHTPVVLGVQVAVAVLVLLVKTRLVTQ
jgi:hypothetical protein